MGAWLVDRNHGGPAGMAFCHTHQEEIKAVPSRPSHGIIFITLCISHIYMARAEKAMAPHSSTLAWKILWREEPGRLQSMGSLRVGHDWVASLSLFTFLHWRRKWQPTPVFLPGESQGRGAWWAAVYGVAQSQTRLKWLSCSSIWLGRHLRQRQRIFPPYFSKLNSISHLFWRSFYMYHPQRIG